MEIRDIIHGSIIIESHERAVVDSKYFQRLRHIKQLGFAEFSYPSATHNRYIHSLGAMRTASFAFSQIFREHPSLGKTELKKLRAVTRLAALLHDIGHGPLSHTSEMAMPPVSDLHLNIPHLSGQKSKRQANHEDYTLKMILDSGLTPILEKSGAEFGIKPIHIAALIDHDLVLDPTLADFFIIQHINYRPLLQQLISSELDADRMDYLRRDSQYAGVSYGQFDYDWLISNLTYHIVEKEKNNEKKAYLTLQHRALYAFEDFLISRYHMFLMVYFHYKSAVFDEMLSQYFKSEDCDYKIPADIETYCQYNDAHLYAHLAKSQNSWAQRITDKKPYRLLVELHSGIPATQSSQKEQDRLLKEIKHDLKTKNINAIETKATGELSKYFRNLSRRYSSSNIDSRVGVKVIVILKCTFSFFTF
jgi:HD superfamily phosphohydrolase